MLLTGLHRSGLQHRGYNLTPGHRLVICAVSVKQLHNVTDSPQISSRIIYISNRPNVLWANASTKYASSNSNSLGIVRDVVWAEGFTYEAFLVGSICAGVWPHLTLRFYLDIPANVQTKIETMEHSFQEKY